MLALPKLGEKTCDFLRHAFVSLFAAHTQRVRHAIDVVEPRGD